MATVGTVPVVDFQAIRTNKMIINKPTTVSTATFQVGDEHLELWVTRTSAGTCAIALPASGADYAGRKITIIDAGGGAGTYNITITPNGSEKINGESTFVISANYNSVTLTCSGSASIGWYVK